MGGAQKHVIDLCTRLHSQNNEVTVLTGSEGILTSQLESAGIPCEVLNHLKRPISPIQDIQFYRELKKRLKELAPDIVAAHSSKAGIVSRLVCNSLGIPNTFTVHGWSFADGVPYLRRRMFIGIEKIVGKFSDQLITVSEADRELGLKYGIVSPDKITTVHNGVLPANIAISPKKLAEDVPLKMVMVARFQAQKDHATLVKSLASLKHLNWQLTFLGDGDKEEEIKMLVEKNDLSEKISFEGSVNNVYDYLEQSNLFLLITNWEGFPLTILEGMAHALPVIASDVGGVKEAIQEGQNGFTVPRGDIQKLKEKIQLLCEDKNLYEQMSEKSFVMYNENYTLQKMCEKIFKIYTQTCNSKQLIN